MREKKINKRQFTLIELIIVIVVIGILAAMALPKFLGVQRNAKVAAMETDLDVIEKAVMQYVTATDDGSYPFIDVNGDKVINEQDLYFKTNNAPQTLKDALLKASGDDGSKIYRLDMDKLKPYISKIKYPDTEYLYSEKSDTAIDPIGKADGDNFIHHIIGSGVNNDNTNENPVLREIKQQVYNNLLFTNGDMIEVFSNNKDIKILNNQNSAIRKNVQRLYEKSYGFYYQDGKLKYSNCEIKLSYPLTVKDEVYFSGYGDEDWMFYEGFVVKEDGTIFYETIDDDGNTKSTKLDIKVNSNEKFDVYKSYDCFSIMKNNSITFYEIDGSTNVANKIREKTYNDGIKDFFIDYNYEIVLSNKNEIYLDGVKTSYVVKDNNFFKGYVFHFVTTDNELVTYSSYYDIFKVRKKIGTNDKVFSNGFICVVLDSDGVFNLLDTIDSEYVSPVNYYKINSTDEVFGDGVVNYVKKQDGTVDILYNKFNVLYSDFDGVTEEELEEILKEYPEDKEEIMNEFGIGVKIRNFKNPLISSDNGQQFIVFGDTILFIDTNIPN